MGMNAFPGQRSRKLWKQERVKISALVSKSSNHLTLV